jgi:hypothetical protein
LRCLDRRPGPTRLPALLSEKSLLWIQAIPAGSTLCVEQEMALPLTKSDPVVLMRREGSGKGFEIDTGIAGGTRCCTWRGDWAD